MREVPLTRGKVALVSDEDYDRVSKYNWCAHQQDKKNDKWRAVSRISTDEFVYLHRFIIDPPSDKVVDHINGNPLDNRRENLRVCSQRENVINRDGLQSNNTTGLVGVSKHPNSETSVLAQIKNHGENIYLGMWSDAHVAGLVRDLWARDLHGEMAYTNFEVVRFGAGKATAKEAMERMARRVKDHLPEDARDRAQIREGEDGKR